MLEVVLPAGLASIAERPSRRDCRLAVSRLKIAAHSRFNANLSEQRSARQRLLLPEALGCYGCEEPGGRLHCLGDRRLLAVQADPPEHLARSSRRTSWTLGQGVGGGPPPEEPATRGFRALLVCTEPPLHRKSARRHRSRDQREPCNLASRHRRCLFVLVLAGRWGRGGSHSQDPPRVPRIRISRAPVRASPLAPLPVSSPIRSEPLSGQPRVFSTLGVRGFHADSVAEARAPLTAAVRARFVPSRTAFLTSTAPDCINRRSGTPRILLCRPVPACK